MEILNNPELVAQLERSRDLPTPPGVAEQIIGLSSQPSSDVSVLADVVSLDPALTVKMLRMANSPLYARQGKIESLEQAVMMFGWNGTLNLALSFSLVSKIEPSSEQGLDYTFFWKRSITAAVACRHLGKVVGINSRKEDLFLPGLLQDIGMLALDKVIPDLYNDIGNKQHHHKFVQELEQNKLGVDHAVVGAWLLNRWNLPQRIIDLVSISHQDDKHENKGGTQLSENCIEVSNVIADCICSDEDQKDYLYAANITDKVLGLDKTAFLEHLETITIEIQNIAKIFELDVGDPKLLNCIAEQAKELLLLRSMETLKTAEELHQAAELLQTKARKLEDSAKRDSLTNIYNRGYLEISLFREFEMSKDTGWPLSIVMVDLDNFKKVNDTYGHDCGDKVIKYAVSILGTCIRASDTLYRYGGEEFVVILPNTGLEGVQSFASRIIETFNSDNFEYQKDISISVKASLGIAIQGEGIDFENWEELLNTADQCLYESKQQGRNRYTINGQQKQTQAAAG